MTNIKQQIELMKMEVEAFKTMANQMADGITARLEQLHPSESETRFNEFKTKDPKEYTKKW